MVFGIALLLVVVVPLIATTVAYEHAKRNPTIAPVHGHAATQRVPMRLRTDRGAGVTTGVLAAVIGPPLVEAGFAQEDGPPWLRLGVVGALILLPLALYLALRPRGQYARGMATGAALVGIALPIVFFALFGTIGLIAGWFS